MTTPDPREPLGRLVRETWVAWAREQYCNKPSWLIPWDELETSQREVDMRIGERVAVTAAAAERERISRLLAKFKQPLTQPDNGYPVDAVSWSDVLSALAIRERGLDAGEQP